MRSDDDRVGDVDTERFRGGQVEVRVGFRPLDVVPRDDRDALRVDVQRLEVEFRHVPVAAGRDRPRNVGACQMPEQGQRAWERRTDRTKRAYASP